MHNELVDILKFFIPLIISFLGIIIALFGVKFQKMKNLSTNYDLISRIYNDFYSGKLSLAKYGVEKYLNFEVGSKEINHILTGNSIYTILTNLKYGRSKLYFNEKTAFYEFKRPFITKIIAFVSYFCSVSPLLFYLVYTKELLNFLGIYTYVILSALILPILLPFAISSILNFRNYIAAKSIVKSNKLLW